MMRVVAVRTADALQTHCAELEDLAAAAMEPNVFYEPWVLLPAIHAFGGGRDLWFVLVYGGAEPGAPPGLCGFFPFERGRRFGGMPVTVFRAWKYGTAYCGLCTPLLRAGSGAEVMAALYAWARESPDGPSLIEWQRFVGDGPVSGLLTRGPGYAGQRSAELEIRTRPLLCRRADAEEFMRLGYSARHLSTNRRKERRLAEQGGLEFRELAASDDVSAWCREFIELESAGWKQGQPGVVGASEASRQFFAAVVTRGWTRGRVMILELRLDGALIGSICNLLAAPGSFLYKVAFDERFGRYSPGELMQQENIRRVHARPDILWMDSLAEPSFTHIYRWLDQRTIRSAVVSTGRPGGELAMTLLPAARWIKSRVGRRSFEPAPSREAAG
jgi:Acetyltransferase (GNAT) domain